MISGRNIFDQPVKDDAKTYRNVTKISIGYGEDYKTACFHY